MSSEQSAVEESQLPADDLQPSVRPKKPKVQLRAQKAPSIFQLCQGRVVQSSVKLTQN